MRFRSSYFAGAAVSQDISSATINGKSIVMIINETASEERKMPSSCDVVCLYTGFRVQGDAVFLRLWDGTTPGFSTGEDSSVIRKAVEYASAYLDAANNEQLNAKEAVIFSLLDKEDDFNSSSTSSSSSSSASDLLLGEEVEVLVADAEVGTILMSGLLPGTWIRIRNLHLDAVLRCPSLNADSHVCTLKPYFRYSIRFFTSLEQGIIDGGLGMSPCSCRDYRSDRSNTYKSNSRISSSSSNCSSGGNKQF